MVRQVAQAGENMRGELYVTADLREVECPAEVLPRDLVAPRVMRHPAGHLRQAPRRSVKTSPVVIAAKTEQARRYLGMQVAHHGGVEMPASDLLIRGAEALYRGEVRRRRKRLI